MSFLNAAKKSSVLITGADSGIGFAYAKHLLNLGHEVMSVGRKREKLEEAKMLCPQLITCQLDLADEQQRKKLYNDITAHFPQMNVLINNAGISGYGTAVTDMKDTTEEEWKQMSYEFNTDLVAPIHLSTLFLPHLLSKERALIANVTSLEAFVPSAQEPVYSAAKAGLHSFTKSLRYQLRNTPCDVVEILPPKVATEMLPEEVRATAMKPEEFVQYAMDLMNKGQEEVGYEETERVLRAGRAELDEMFCSNNREAQ